jgi:hypothetical protein
VESEEEFVLGTGRRFAVERKARYWSISSGDCKRNSDRAIVDSCTGFSEELASRSLAIPDVAMQLIDCIGLRGNDRLHQITD